MSYDYGTARLLVTSAESPEMGRGLARGGLRRMYVYGECAKVTEHSSSH